jgi:hypothetical protein
MQTVIMEDSFAGTHISSVAQRAVETLATYGDQDVEVTFTFNETKAFARRGDSAEDVISRWDKDREAAHQAYISSPEYKERVRRDAEELERKTNAVMKETANGEAEMRESSVPWPYTMKQLTDYVESVTNRQHDYGTCVYAMSMAATAAFYYVAHQLGVTEFQSSCADMDILRRTRSLKGPWMILKAEDALYPQYDLREKLSGMLDSSETRQWLRDEARKKLIESPTAHPDVIAHWKRLAE